MKAKNFWYYSPWLLARTNHSTIKLLLSDVLFGPFPPFHLSRPPMFHRKHFIGAKAINHPNYNKSQKNRIIFLFYSSQVHNWSNVISMLPSFFANPLSPPNLTSAHHKLWQIRMNYWIIAEWNWILKTYLLTRNILSNNPEMYNIRIYLMWWHLFNINVRWIVEPGDGSFSNDFILSDWLSQIQLPPPATTQVILHSGVKSAISHNFHGRRFQGLGINIQLLKYCLSNPRDAQSSLKILI